ncbi:hypothetical protein [Mesorhizobium sp. M0800]|uniref:hypothetical protein n=1 Tax=Mesorhizobium sp. M0800 TaxID=2957000 RepID=UPI00333DCF82
MAFSRNRKSAAAKSKWKIESVWLSGHVKYDATGLASLVNAGAVTPLELTRLARQAHDEVNPHINAVIEFCEDADTVAGANAGLFGL